MKKGWQCNKSKQQIKHDLLSFDLLFFFPKAAAHLLLDLVVAIYAQLSSTG